jgi:RNA polymerase sigma-70 factor (ECF subfamily)
VSTAIARLRTRGGQAEDALDDLAPRFDADGRWADTVTALPFGGDAAECPGTRAAFRRALALLPHPFGTVLVLRDLEDLDGEAVAALLDTTESAVRSRLHRARQAFRTLLTRELAAEATRSTDDDGVRVSSEYAVRGE